ncbi:MAG: hypothetical protein R3F19_17780 [Verrucomicrobiales bacterium]
MPDVNGHWLTADLAWATSAYEGGRVLVFDLEKRRAIDVSQADTDEDIAVVTDLDNAFVEPSGSILLSCGNRLARLDPKTGQLAYVDRSATLPEAWTDCDAALINPKNGILHFFRKDRYFYYDLKKMKPVAIERIGIDGWRGIVPTPRISAAVVDADGFGHFFFTDGRFSRYNFDIGYVDRTGRIGEDGWPGVEPKGIAAAWREPSGHIILSNGKTYQRYSMIEERVVSEGAFKELVR